MDKTPRGLKDGDSDGDDGSGSDGDDCGGGSHGGGDDKPLCPSGDSTVSPSPCPSTETIYLPRIPLASAAFWLGGGL